MSISLLSFLLPSPKGLNTLFVDPPPTILFEVSRHYGIRITSSFLMQYITDLIVLFFQFRRRHPDSLLACTLVLRLFPQTSIYESHYNIPPL